LLRGSDLVGHRTDALRLELGDQLRRPFSHAEEEEATAHLDQVNAATRLERKPRHDTQETRPRAARP
jgi:hypothetical protein